MAVHDQIKAVKYSAIADTKEDAWLFYMDHVDEFTKATLELVPVFVVDTQEDDDEYLEKYQVTVSGEIEEERENADG